LSDESLKPKLPLPSKSFVTDMFMDDRLIVVKLLLDDESKPRIPPPKISFGVAILLVVMFMFVKILLSELSRPNRPPPPYMEPDVEIFNITNNSIFINTTLQPLFNYSANITITGLSLSLPQAYRDQHDSGSFTSCSDCSYIDYTAGKFQFYASHFTTYKADEYNPNITVCMDLAGPDRTYNLTIDLNATGTCMYVRASNVSLNCNGHTITGSQAGWGINISDSDYINIQDCKIRNFSRAISVQNTNLSLFNNNTIFQNNGDLSGIYTKSSTTI